MANRTILFGGVILCALLHNSAALNILFFFGVSTYSHRITVWPLVEALVEKGHNVTFLQPHKNKNPNPKIIEIRTPEDLPMKDAVDMFLTNRIEGKNIDIYLTMFLLPKFGLTACDMILSDPNNQKWIENSKFDLVVIDALYNECGYLLAHKFGAKIIIFGTTHPFAWWIDGQGLPAEITNYIPELHGVEPAGMESTFLSRVKTNIHIMMINAVRKLYYYPQLNAMGAKYLKMDSMPSMTEIEKNVSLVFSNSHFSEEFPRPLPPNIVPIGGMHCKEDVKPLPKEFQSFLKDDNFMYISFGSAAEISTAPIEIQRAFFDALRAHSKLKFLWKWNGPRPSDMPANVMIAKWMPQQDILGHKNIKGFITHGGLLGIQEAIIFGVPMISMPVFAEQYYNSERLRRTGRGIHVSFHKLTSEKLKDAIRDIVVDPRYKSNMMELRQLFKDRPHSPIETAVWWTEYVMRHENPHEILRPVTANLYWFQTRLLDVWIFLLISVLIIVYIDFMLLKCLCSYCCKKKGPKQKIKKN